MSEVLLTVEVILSVGGSRRYWRPSELLDIPRGRSLQPGLESQQHCLSGSVFLGWWGPFFFSCKVEVSRLLWGCGREDAHGWALPLTQGWGAVLWPWWLLSLLLSQWSLGCSFLHLFLRFSTISISHTRAEKRPLHVPNPPGFCSRRPCLVCWCLAFPGNILPTYFSRIFLKSSAS